jgi:hypothetical protein
MNYFAHGRRFVDEPYVLAGTAVPDWLRVSDRQVRVREKHALAFVGEGCASLADVARGIVRHHQDDAWFHQTRAFAELSLRLTAMARDALPCDEGFRPSFLGHVLVELLLDAALIEAEPGQLERYYQALAVVEPAAVAAAVGRMVGDPPQRLATFVELFCRERFLWDYLDDGKLWVRLNQVMRRVGLAPLPPTFVEALPDARQAVAGQAEQLLARG